MENPIKARTARLRMIVAIPATSRLETRMPRPLLAGIKGVRIAAALIWIMRGGRFDRWIKVKNRKHPAFSRVMEQ